MPRASVYAQWFSHVNAVQPPREIRTWLTDRQSLTVKLVERSHRFRVQRLRQKDGLCLADECSAIGMRRRVAVQEREVLLKCDDCAVVFAHTVVPKSASASDWPFFSSLGERSLGTTLFGDPLVRRGALQFARLDRHHPLTRRAAAAIESKDFPRRLFARRCLYRRRKGVLLVTEIFLPSMDMILDQRGTGNNK